MATKFLFLVLVLVTISQSRLLSLPESPVESLESVYCQKYECKPKTMVFDSDTCSYEFGGTYYLSPCSDREHPHCQLHALNSTCIAEP
jgi:hypothetical protein